MIQCATVSPLLHDLQVVLSWTNFGHGQNRLSWEILAVRTRPAAGLKYSCMCPTFCIMFDAALSCFLLKPSMFVKGSGWNLALFSDNTSGVKAAKEPGPRMQSSDLKTKRKARRSFCVKECSCTIYLILVPSLPDDAEWAQYEQAVFQHWYDGYFGYSAHYQESLDIQFL